MTRKQSLFGALLIAPLLLAQVAFGQTSSACAVTDTGAIKRACYVVGDSAFVYGHGVLGDTDEWSAIALYKSQNQNALSAIPDAIITASPDHIFEDIAPRLFDITGDGQPEVIVVESQKSKGARLAIYSTTAQPKRIAATPYIGSANRWLAPIGFADFNNDGDVDIAYVDRPHLAKILRVWTYKNAKLTETANIDGLSNHRIGDNFISGGVRTCAGTPEIITADGGWKRIISTRFENGALTKTDIGPYRNKSSFKRALTC